ncbi:MAG: hypothetical protein OXG41_01200 [Acidimicrobiaceae bacterium]|nr:hypothetical protein [Acidimicrobiaceae bacterium]
MTAPDDTSRLRRALAVLAALVALVVVVVVLSRCSTPSTINTAAAAGTGSDSLNAAAAGLAAVVGWAGEPADVVRVRWLDPDTAVTTVRLNGGEHVAVTSVHTERGWTVPAPPSPTAAPPHPKWEGPPKDNLTAARDDPRWLVTQGFLDAWLAGESTERWTAVNFEAPPLSVAYDSWEFTGLGTPQAVTGTAIEVIPVDFEATSADTTRTYRIFVAVVADPTSRLTVNAVGHRSPH